MATIWFSPHGCITADSTLTLERTISGTVVKCTIAGTKSISAALPMPAGAAVEQVVVCYQLSHDRSFISRIRLVELITPGAAAVKFEDTTSLKSTTAVCYTTKVRRYAPAGTVTLELRLEFTDSADTITLGGIGLEIEDDCAAERNDHVLGEFGPYTDVKDAYKTLDTAVTKILAQGGGVLCIPRDAPHGFWPRNRNENGVEQPAVTIIDYRKGIESTYAPPIGITNSDASATAGRHFERDLAIDLPWQGSFPVAAITSRAAAGASSYSTRLTRAVDHLASRKLHVPTLRGAFKGQVLLVDPRSAAEELITVAALGIDTDGPYLLAIKLNHDHPQDAQIYNKNDVGALAINDVSNCDNQSASLTVRRTTYGTGDSFAVAAVLSYQGNINSGLGDEGGVVFAGNMEHDLDYFRGKVEHWDVDNRVLKYLGGVDGSGKPHARSPQKLGTSRPIINFHPTKRVVAGKVTVVDVGPNALREPAPSPSNIIDRRFIVGNETASNAWTESLVGRFIAIDDPTEYYGDPAGAEIDRVYRWWLITKIETRTDGRKNLYVERAIAHRNYFDGPTLFRAGNYAPVELGYIIRPGAWVSDLREGISGNVQGNVGTATADDVFRKILLAPSPAERTTDDFAAGDPIANPPGPDVWLPTGFRARHVHDFPGSYKGGSFLSENLGNVQVGPAVLITGRGDSSDLDKVKARMKDASTEYQAGVYINAATDTAIVIRGVVTTSAIDLWQTNDNIKRIRWFDKDATLAGEVHVDPVSGMFILDTKGIDLLDQVTIRHNGLSATEKRPGRLGQRRVIMPAGTKKATIGLTPKEPDAQYSIFVTCSWKTMAWISRKTDTEFDVEFSEGNPAGETFDWLLVRLNT